MRYCYIKTSNAVRDFKKIQNNDYQVVGGSETFLAYFLKLVGNDPAMIISLHTIPLEDEKIFKNNIIVFSRSRFLRNRYLPSKIGSFFCQIKNSLSIFCKIILFRPQLVLCWATSSPFWASFLSSRIIRARFVYSKHTRFFNSSNSWYHQIISSVDKFLIHYAHAIIVHGPYLLQETLMTGVDPSRVFSFDCTYPADSSWSQEQFVKQSNHILKEYEELRQILFLGRMECSKGIFDLMAACEGILLADKELRLIFAGQGKDLETLENQVVKKGLSSQVRFLGGVEHKMLPEIIRECYCVVTPTKSSFPEGRCMAAMEALVMGKPVIAPDFGPFPYLVQDNINGFLYEADNVDSLREKIEKLINDNELYLRLVQGAKQTGLKLLSNKEDYYQALRKAIEL